ncbi:MAG: hypothetical protein JSS81_25730 [Acidobacteria bacterium]|nr:hypothetical protein [Acidobacteriota bacterium]
MNYEDFGKLVGTKFDIDGFDGKQIEFFELSERKQMPMQEVFSLFFRGSRDFFLEQKLYELSAPEIETSILFLVPVAQDDEYFTYQAVFNRLLKP